MVGLTWEEGIYSWSNTIERSKNEASKHVPVVFCECLQVFLTGRIILSDLSPLLATFLSLQKNLNLSGSDGNQGMEMHICLYSSIWKHKKILILLYTVCCPIYDMLPSFSAQAGKKKEKEKEKEIIVEYSINYISWENNLLMLCQWIISRKEIWKFMNYLFWVNIW